MAEFPIVAYTDGASSGNPGPGGWGAIVATPGGRVVELGGGVERTTNNAMELTAAVRALRALEKTPGRVQIYTDSVYLIRGITQWIWGWIRRGWTTAEGDPVANRKLWEALAALVRARKDTGGEVAWSFVRGHRGTPGNERADRIAVGFRDGKKPRLFRGSLLEYDIPVHDLPEPQDLPEPDPSGERRTTKKVAYSYLSFVDDRVVRHRTWDDCKRRVEGRSGARFKKAISAEEEPSILAGWGRSISDVADEP